MSLREIRFKIGEAPPSRLDKALARDVPEQAALSRTRLARLVEAGAVSIDGVVSCDLKATVRAGADILLRLPEAAESHIGPEAIPLQILHEDADLIVVNKPAGMVVHPAPGTPNGTLVNALLAHCGTDLSGVGGVKRPGIVHRIDKDTSGLLVVAKTDAAHHGLAAQFEKHSVERAYACLVYGIPDANDPRLGGLRGTGFEPGNILRLTTRLARHRTDRQKQAVFFETGRHAVTRARLTDSFGTPPVLALLQCWLETGRTHQIRVHLAYAGHGLVGDPVYGGKRRIAEKALSERVRAAVAGFPRQALHAQILGFTHPTLGRYMRFEADVPPDFADLLSKLRENVQ